MSEVGPVRWSSMCGVDHSAPDEHPWSALIYEGPRVRARQFKIFCVYMLDVECADGRRALKVGHTGRLRDRIQQISQPTGNPFGTHAAIMCRAIGYCWNMRRALTVERAIQKYYRRYVLHEESSIEWFGYNERMVGELVVDLRDLHDRWLAEYYKESITVAGAEFKPPLPRCSEGVRVSWR